VAEIFFRKISEYFLIRDSTRIPSILWFEYTRAREEVRWALFLQYSASLMHKQAAKFLLAILTLQTDSTFQAIEFVYGTKFDHSCVFFSIQETSKKKVILKKLLVFAGQINTLHMNTTCNIWHTR
jgi:hypothetical protein